SSEDHEIAELLQRELTKKKIKLLAGAMVNRVGRSHDGIHIYLNSGEELIAEKLLVSIGRAFNVENIGLEALGILKGPRGEIVVNERMETNIGGIYAIGDVTGGPLLAHVASRQGLVAACNSCGIETRMDYSVVP